METLDLGSSVDEVEEFVDESEILSGPLLRELRRIMNNVLSAYRP